MVGVGAVGGYFGGRLAAAGAEVSFVARGATLDVLRREGLRIESIDGDLRVNPVRATDDPAEIGEVDGVLFGVKAWQLRQAAETARPLFGEQTFALPLQNGVEAPEILARVLGPHRVLGGLCRIIAKLEGPGHIRHSGARPTIELGELDDRPSDRTERFRQLAERSGFRAKIPGQGIQAAMWGKFLMIVPTSAVGAVTRAPIGEILARPETRELLEASVREIDGLARVRGIALSDDAVERTMAFVEQLPPNSTASMQRDLMAGRPSELEAQCGAVLRLAEEVSHSVPVHRFLYAALVLQEEVARKG